MGTKYRQMGFEDRVLLQHLLEQQKSKREIARILGFHLSTIYREVKRNLSKFYSQPLRFYYFYKYDGTYAEHKAVKRKYRKPYKLYRDKMLQRFVIKKLVSGWSPLQISGRLKHQSRGLGYVSAETIYRYIYSNMDLRLKLHKYLRRKHLIRANRYGRKKRFIPEEMLIHQRPGSINAKDEFGHWEADLMMFKRGVRSNLITLREMKTRYCIAIRNSNKKARETACQIIRRLTGFAKHVKSITFDQGSEFFKFRWIEKTLDTKIYFCDPGSPHQKGSIENVNGAIRLLLPRSLNIASVSQQRIDKLIDGINERPMACHDYQTPKEMFNAYIGYK